MAAALSANAGTTYMPVEMAMFIGGMRMATGTNGKTAAGIRFRNRIVGDSVRDSMLNENAKQREQQNRNLPSQKDTPRGDRASQSATTRQLDTSTFRTLERDRAARKEGVQRSRDFGTYQRSGGNAGGFRSGGGSRGGGGFRGG